VVDVPAARICGDGLCAAPKGGLLPALYGGFDQDCALVLFLVTYSLY